MASYKIVLKRDAEKELRQLPKRELRAVTEKIAHLGLTPRPVGCEKLKGSSWYRIRHGDYRVVYVIDDVQQHVTVLRVAHRKDVYRDV